MMIDTGIDYGNSRAILIGTSRYSDEYFPPVPAVEPSLDGMRTVLEDPGLGGWPASRVECWHNPAATPGMMAEDLRELARSTTGLLVVYFVGHGTLSRDGELCLVLPGTRHRDADLTGLELRRLRAAVDDSPATAKVVILDCCYSGRAVGRTRVDQAPFFKALSANAVPDLTRLRGAYTLTASNMIEELARWSGDASTPTAFTGALLGLIHRGLENRPAVLSLDDFYPSLWRLLDENSLPEPRGEGVDWGGRLPFTLNAAHPEVTSASAALGPREIPPQLRMRAGHPRAHGAPLSLVRKVRRRDALIAGGALLAGAAAAEFGPRLTSSQPSARADSLSAVPGVTLGSALGGHTQAWVVATGKLSGKPIAVSGGKEGDLIVWDLTSTAAEARWGRPISLGSGVSGLAVATVSAKAIAVSGSADGRVRIWDLATRRELGPLPRLHTSQVSQVAIAMVGRKPIAISGSDDGTTRTWDISSYAPLDRLPFGAKAYGVTAGYLADGTPVAITGADDASVRVWNLTSYTQVGATMKASDASPVFAVTSGMTNGQVVALSGDSFGYVVPWNLKTFTQAGSTLGRDQDQQPVRGIAIGTLRGKTIAASVGDATGLLWDLSDGYRPLGSLKPQEDSVWGVSLTKVAGNTVVITGCLSGHIRKFSLGPTT